MSCLKWPQDKEQSNCAKLLIEMANCERALTANNII